MLPRHYRHMPRHPISPDRSLHQRAGPNRRLLALADRRSSEDCRGGPAPRPAPLDRAYRGWRPNAASAAGRRPETRSGRSAQPRPRRSCREPAPGNRPGHRRRGRPSRRPCRRRPACRTARPTPARSGAWTENWPTYRYTMIAVIRGPYCAGASTPSSASPQVVTPQEHRRAIIRCSVTRTEIGGMSNTCRRSIPDSGAPARSAPQPPHPPGSCRTTSSGSAT